MRHLIVACFGAAWLMAPPEATASVIIYDQLPGQNSNELRISSTLDFFGGTPGYRVADNFVLSQSAVISDVHWWGDPVAGGTDFSFTFYSDGGGVPGSVLQTSGGSLSTTSVSVGSGFDPVSFYSSDLFSPFSASAGTTYWISIFNQAPDGIWGWLAADTYGDGARQGQNPGPPWSASVPNMAFQLTAQPVPEPGALTLLALGLAGLRARRSRQRAA